MPYSFRDLKIWQEALELMLELYTITSQFPKEELYSLTNQIRRASISVMANIAEGHDRPTHQERIRFFVMSRGSLQEIRSHFSAALALNYPKRVKFDHLDERCSRLARSINSFIRSLKEQRSR